MSNHTPPTQAELDAWKEKGVPLNAMIRLIAEVERLRGILIVMGARNATER